MAPLPPSNTQRFKFHYSVGPHLHTTELRTGVSPAVAGSLMAALWTALGTTIYSTTIDSVEFAAAGSNIFNAITTGIEGNAYGTGAVGDTATPYYVNFIGRSAGGRRSRMAIFGIKSVGTNYRYTPGEDTSIDAALAVLVVGGPNVWAIDGLPVIWKSYVNAGVNAHWQKVVR